MGLVNWELIPLVPPKTLDDLPKSEDPYYIATRDGIFIRKTTLLGDCLLPQKEMPDFLASMGTSKNGIFWFSAPKIPARIMNQAASFFKKVFDTKGSEAEVLILYNDEIVAEADRFKLLVPTQLTSHVNVKSIYEPSEIEGNWQLIGSIHSHCDFGAFHSSTDTEDASDFMGIHITIGNIDTATPSFAAMVTVSGVIFNYEIERVANVTNIRTDRPVPNAWLDLVASAAQIDKIDRSKFKSIPKEFMDNWLGLNQKKTAKKPDFIYKGTTKPRTSPIIPKRDNKGPIDGNLRWSYEMQAYVPQHYLKDGRIRNEYYLDALEDTLANLREAALERDVLVVYDLDFLPKKDDDLVTDWKDYKDDLLPGPFALLEEALDEDARIQAYRNTWRDYDNE